jgi:eukaryotic-like serine/threonine-protein kinase
MTPERWQQVKELFNAALERDPAQRAAFLAEACAADPALREEVASLLAEEQQLGSFIDTPAVAQSEATPVALRDRHIGPYRVLRELGHGGMGLVLLAERADQQYQKQVAIKLLRAGLDVDFILRRFRNERQILANLDHPHIARLLDGGVTTEGLPYLVMEFVEGAPLDRYCDEHRLDTKARLKLFQQICDAVHYAHRNLIVHRDIKPSNILVTAAGTPKLLDFGIAKILKPDTFPDTVQPTGTWDRPMTPAYASPEQVRGLPITTASDVYSLGVLLYELLTGHRPYQVAGSLPHEMARVICEQEPQRPSTVINRIEELIRASGEVTVITPQQVSEARAVRPEKLSRLLQGDLDNIVLMALRKEPERRYSSVEQLAQDIENYLQGRPVNARQDTLSYRASKFIQRHKTGVAATALVMLTLLGSTVFSLRQARLAERRFNEVRKLANQYLFEFHDAIETLPGSTPARQLVVKRALEYLDRLAQEARNDHSLQQELATAYLKVGDVQGRPGFANLGDNAGALASYRKALAIRAALLTADAGDASLRREQAVNHDRLGDTLRIMGETATALQHYRQALELRQASLPSGGPDLAAQIELAGSYERIGDQLALLGQRAQAIEHQRRALPSYEQAVASEPQNAQYQRRLFIGLIKLGDRLSAAGDKRAALEHYQQALPLAHKLAAASANNARAQRELAVAHDKVGNGLAALGESAAGNEAALAQYRAALRIRETLAAADPQNGEAQRDLATSYGKLAEMSERLGDLPAALQYVRRALVLDAALAKADPDDAQNQLDIAFDREKLGNLLQQQGELLAALAEHQQAAQLRQAAAAKDPDNAELKRDLAGSYAKLGELYLTLAQQHRSSAQQPQWWAEARANYQRSAALWQELRARRPLQPDEQADAEKVLAALVKWAEAQSRSATTPDR